MRKYFTYDNFKALCERDNSVCNIYEFERYIRGIEHRGSFPHGKIIQKENDMYYIDIDNPNETLGVQICFKLLTDNRFFPMLITANGDIYGYVNFFLDKQVLLVRIDRDVELASRIFRYFRSGDVCYIPLRDSCVYVKSTTLLGKLSGVSEKVVVGKPTKWVDKVDEIVLFIYYSGTAANKYYLKY